MNGNTSNYVYSIILFQNSDNTAFHGANFNKYKSKSEEIFEYVIKKLIKLEEKNYT